LLQSDLLKSSKILQFKVVFTFALQRNNLTRGKFQSLKKSEFPKPLGTHLLSVELHTKLDFFSVV